MSSQLLTTMMAILPPTSPTTVMGGFSLAIITEMESRFRYLREHCPDCKISEDWVKWVKKKFCALCKLVD